MFSWCFKCQTADDDDYHQRPKTRNASQNVQYTAVAAPTTNESSDSNKSVEQLQREVLEAHNRYRAKHGVGPLTLSKQLNRFATEWAKHLADSNTMQHCKNNKYGENLYMATGVAPQIHELAVQAWYDEIKNYNFNKPGFSSNTGHFTQVVWKTSKELGVGIIKRADHTWVVCNYDPPGNVMGQYMDYVPPLVEETVTKIIDKMKGPKKTIFKKPQKKQEVDEVKEEPVAVTHSAKDLKLWSKYELECLDSHNKYRAMHGSPAMKLNRKLCNLAQDWSNNLAKKRSISHRPNNEYGENIYYCMNMEPTAEQCVKSWYDEIKNYKFTKPGFSSNTGHFTQVVWRHSLELGVGIAKANNMTFVVCNYSPAGNVMSQYKDQVPRPGAKPTPSTSNSNSTNAAAGSSSSSTNGQAKTKDPQSFEEVCLDSHNNFRAIHGSEAMSVNKNLSVFANDWAQHLAAHNKIMTRNNNRFGENLFYMTGHELEGHEPVEYWYSGIDVYNFQRPGYTAASANFTQVIWKNSKELGVGVAKVGRSTYVVCNYNPKGNIKDEYAENVPMVGGECVLVFTKHQVPVEVDSFVEHLLICHNKYRAKHGCPPLQLSQTLMDYCEKYAESLVVNKPCTQIPLYAVSIIHFPAALPSPDDIVKNWYNEILNYDFQEPQFNEATKHFTQIIWKDTKFMGVGVRKKEQNSIVVISYEPSGNKENQYAENVPAPVI